MDRFHQIVAVVVRLAAILLLVRGLSFLPDWYFSYSSGQIDSTMIALTAVYCVLVVVGTILLWKFPLFIAHRIVPFAENKEQILDLPLARLQAALLSVFGIGLVVYTVPDVVFRYAYIRHLQLASDPGYPIDFGAYVVLFRASLEILFGIWLALGSDGIIRVVSRLRYAGVQK